MKLAAVGVMTLILAGCTGTLYTAEGENISLSPNTKKGIYAFYPKNVVQLFETTKFTNKNGEILASKNGVNGQKCIPQRQMKIVQMPDFSKRFRIYYEPGILENNTFAVKLSAGLLESVNTESSPDRGQTLTNLTGAAAQILPFAGIPAAAAGAPISGVRLCNSEPHLVGIYDAPATRPFEDIRNLPED